MSVIMTRDIKSKLCSHPYRKLAENERNSAEGRGADSVSGRMS